MASRIFIIKVLILVLGLSTVPLVFAANRWNNPRDLDPIIVSGNNIIGLSSVPTNELYVYAYDSSQNSWRPIPFQIDEKDNTTDFWLANPNGIFDGNDELVFMAKDLGDQAPDGSYWIDDLISKNYQRVEITMTDTVGIDRQAWVYVYRTTNPMSLSPEFYLNYVAAHPDSAGADTIIARTYIENHKTSGIPVDWLLPEGSGEDILDRQKVRIGMLLFGIWYNEIPESLLEDPLFTTTTLRIKVGPVRVVREVFWHIDLSSLGIDPFDFSLPLLFYPFSIESGGVSGTIDASNDVRAIRQSFDLNPNADGMRLYNRYNRNGVLINGRGNNDGINNTLDDSPAVNWWLITGNQGSYATVFRITPIGQTRTLYYKDFDEIDDEDTGDKMSWGDTGILISSQTDIVGNISFAYRAYYLGPNKPVNLGDTLATNFVSSLQVSYQMNTYVPVELSFFKAIEVQGKVLLEWATETETNNYGFEIYRKIQEQDNWDRIAAVEGQGTTTTPHKYSFTDQTVDIGVYYYRLKQIDYDGSFVFSNEIKIEVMPPTTFSLYQNYPNPFNPETVICYRIPKLDPSLVPVELKIYNMLGNEVRKLVQKNQGAGYYSVSWDGRNNQGEVVKAGSYIYRLRAGSFIKTNKMLLLR